MKFVKFDVDGVPLYVAVDKIITVEEDFSKSLVRCVDSRYSITVHLKAEEIVRMIEEAHNA